MGRIRVKWLYESPSVIDGYRILVEPYIPPPAFCKRVTYHEWIPSVSPSPVYKFSLNNNPDFFPEFEQYYCRMLSERVDELKAIASLAYKQNLTLLYDSVDQRINHALILQKILIKIRNE